MSRAVVEVTGTNLAVMVDLDAASNLSGALTDGLRWRIYAAIASPTDLSWEHARTIILNGQTLMTLWQAVLLFTDYSHGVPTTMQIVDALRAATR